MHYLYKIYIRDSAFFQSKFGIHRNGENNLVNATDMRRIVYEA